MMEGLVRRYASGSSSRVLAVLSVLVGALVWAYPVFAAEAPVVEEASVTDVASTSATLHARINPGGVGTSYRFEYGPTAAYGSSVPVPDGVVGSVRLIRR